MLVFIRIIFCSYVYCSKKIRFIYFFVKQDLNKLKNQSVQLSQKSAKLESEATDLSEKFNKSSSKFDEFVEKHKSSVRNTNELLNNATYQVSSSQELLASLSNAEYDIAQLKSTHFGSCFYLSLYLIFSKKIFLFLMLFFFWIL